MKRSGFTLVELIFAIVIIGVLAAIAVPQYRQLQENAQISNIVKYYTDIVSSARSSYMNEIELNNVAAANLNVTDLYDFRGRGWVISNNNDTATYTVNIGGQDQTFAVVYDNAGSLTLTTTIAAATTEAARIEGKITDKTGMAFTNHVNTTTLTLTE